jgi:hypothetical protein
MGDVCSLQVCRGHLRIKLIDDFSSEMALIPGWKRFGPLRQAVLLSFAWNFGADFYGRKGFESISRVLKEGSLQPEIYRQMAEVLSEYIQSGKHELMGLVKRRQREAELWEQEDDGTIGFIATKDTHLKKAAIPEQYLTEAGKIACPPNELILISRLEEIPASSHAWVTFKGSSDPWAIYLPDWIPECVELAKPLTGEVDWLDFSAKAGEYITVGEVLQHDSRRTPENGSEEEMKLLLLCKEFDAIRKAWGSGIGVTSGYRPEPINTNSGGDESSYHIQGMALDIFPMDNKIDDFHRWLHQRWSGGYGDGRQLGFIHIDTRHSGMFHPRAGVKPYAFWEY